MSCFHARWRSIIGWRRFDSSDAEPAPLPGLAELASVAAPAPMATARSKIRCTSRSGTRTRSGSTPAPSKAAASTVSVTACFAEFDFDSASCFEICWVLRMSSGIVAADADASPADDAGARRWHVCSAPSHPAMRTNMINSARFNASRKDPANMRSSGLTFRSVSAFNLNAYVRMTTDREPYARRNQFGIGRKVSGNIGRSQNLRVSLTKFHFLWSLEVRSSPKVEGTIE